MPTLYKAYPGTLAKQPITGATFIHLDGFDSILQGGRLVATTFRMGRNQDSQYSKTLSSKIFAYAFGESLGRVEIGGLIFFADCGGPTSQAIQDVNDYYSQYNIYTRDSPVIVSFGGSSFSCYLENMHIQAESSEYNYGSFAFGLTKIPQND